MRYNKISEFAVRACFERPSMRFTARFCKIPSYSRGRRLLLRRLFKRAANKIPPITARKISFVRTEVEIFATELNFKIPALFADAKISAVSSARLSAACWREI